MISKNTKLSLIAAACLAGVAPVEAGYKTNAALATTFVALPFYRLYSKDAAVKPTTYSFKDLYVAVKDLATFKSDPKAYAQRVWEVVDGLIIGQPKSGSAAKCNKDNGIDWSEAKPATGIYGTLDSKKSAIVKALAWGVIAKFATSKEVLDYLKGYRYEQQFDEIKETTSKPKTDFAGNVERTADGMPTIVKTTTTKKVYSKTVRKDLNIFTLFADIKAALA